MSDKIELNIAWLNVNGLNSTLRGKTIGSFLDEFIESKYDCIMIQEPRYKKIKQDNDMNWESLCHSKKMTSLFTANERGKGGVAVIWKNNSVETKIQDLRITEIVQDEAML